jgi:hypothetical protein
MRAMHEHTSLVFGGSLVFSFVDIVVVDASRARSLPSLTSGITLILKS